MFVNQQGYSLVKIPQTDPAVYDFTLNAEKPLTFIHPDGWRLQSDRHFQTDMGSIPKRLQRFLPKDKFLLSFSMHDSAYGHGGLFIAGQDDSEFVFWRMTRREIDDLFCLMLISEGCDPWPARAIWLAVRIGGKGRCAVVEHGAA